MRRFTKVVLTICGVGLIFAVICAGAGFLLGGSPRQIKQMAQTGELNIIGRNLSAFPYSRWNDWDDADNDWDDADNDWDDWNDWDAADYVTTIDETYAADDVKNMDLDISYGEVIFEESENNQILIKVNADSSFNFSCKLDGDTVKLSDKKANKANHHSKIVITIPERKAFDDFILDTDAGQIDMDVEFTAANMQLDLQAGQLIASDLIVEDTLSLNVGAGQSELSDIHVKNVSLNCGMGQIDFEGRITGDLDGECAMGNISIDLEGDERDFDYSLKCGIGRIVLNNNSYSSLGRSQKINNNAEQKMSLDCGLGEIDVSIYRDL